jgi:hypothetical protein
MAAGGKHVHEGAVRVNYPPGEHWRTGLLNEIEPTQSFHQWMGLPGVVTAANEFPQQKRDSGRPMTPSKYGHGNVVLAEDSVKPVGGTE